MVCVFIKIFPGSNFEQTKKRSQIYEKPPFKSIRPWNLFYTLKVFNNRLCTSGLENSFSYSVRVYNECENRRYIMIIKHTKWVFLRDKQGLVNPTSFLHPTFFRKSKNELNKHKHNEEKRLTLYESWGSSGGVCGARSANEKRGRSAEPQWKINLERGALI